MQAAAVLAQERQYEEELRERELALEDALDARAIRGEPLGQDRHHRSYWWYPGLSPLSATNSPARQPLTIA